MQYVVQQNETIVDIARKTGSDPQEIIFTNYLDEATPIQAGDILEVPGEGGEQMQRFQLGGQIEKRPPQAPSAPPSRPRSQPLPMMGGKLPDSGIRNKNLIQSARQPSKSRMPAGALQSQQKSAKRFGKVYGQGGKGSPFRPGGRPGGPPMGGRPPMGGPRPGGPQGGRGGLPQPVSGGPGSRWMDSFLSRRQFQGGGLVPPRAPSPQQARPQQQSSSPAQAMYQQAMQRLQSSGIRGQGARPKNQGAQPQGFAQGGTVGPPNVIPYSPQASGIEPFQQRAKATAPFNPYPQGNLGQGPQSTQAQGLASLGRGGDSMLMHVNKDEVNQMATGINPETGLPEALPFLAALAPILSVVSTVGGIVGQAVGGGGGGGGGALPGAPAPVQKGEYKAPEDPREGTKGGPRPPSTPGTSPTGQPIGGVTLPGQQPTPPPTPNPSQPLTPMQPRTPAPSAQSPMRPPENKQGIQSLLASLQPRFMGR